jgi:transcriptional regulator with XRE-family HTH domain
MQEKFNHSEQFFSDRLKMALKSYPHNKGELARRVGVSPVTVSRWLAGRVPDTVYGSKLADELSVRFNWLIFGDGEMKTTAVVAEEWVPFRVKPITQSVADGAKNSTADDLWEHIASTASGIAQLYQPSMRLKVSEDLITMIRAAIEKDQQTIIETTS